MRASVVCCYNNEELFEAFVKSLKGQDEEAAVVGIDNRENQFSSCADALNAGLAKVETEYVIFSHQDIVFTEPSSLRGFVDYLEKIGRNDILGVAGVKKDVPGVYTNIWQGEGSAYAGRNRVQGLMKCQTLDECFFGGTTAGFREHPFDHTICDNWHLYGVERCLSALKRGDDVYVCDVRLRHLSGGNINHIYNRQLYALKRKYARDFDYVRTCCGFGSTRPVLNELGYLKAEFAVWRRGLARNK